MKTWTVNYIDKGKEGSLSFNWSGKGEPPESFVAIELRERLKGKVTVLPETTRGFTAYERLKEGYKIEFVSLELDEQ